MEARNLFNRQKMQEPVVFKFNEVSYENFKQEAMVAIWGVPGVKNANEAEEGGKVIVEGNFDKDEMMEKLKEIDEFVEIVEPDVNKASGNSIFSAQLRREMLERAKGFGAGKVEPKFGKLLQGGQAFQQQPPGVGYDVINQVKKNDRWADAREQLRGINKKQDRFKKEIRKVGNNAKPDEVVFPNYKNREFAFNPQQGPYGKEPKYKNWPLEGSSSTLLRGQKEGDTTQSRTSSTFTPSTASSFTQSNRSSTASSSTLATKLSTESSFTLPTRSSIASSFTLNQGARGSESVAKKGRNGGSTKQS